LAVGQDDAARCSAGVAPVVEGGAGDLEFAADFGNSEVLVGVGMLEWGHDGWGPLCRWVGACLCVVTWVEWGVERGGGGA
jgi:hypothetical protein